MWIVAHGDWGLAVQAIAPCGRGMFPGVLFTENSKFFDWRGTAPQVCNYGRVSGLGVPVLMELGETK
jgi:hypothetical protein